MSKRRSYTLREVLAEVFVDENKDFVRMLLILCHIQASKCAKPVGKIVWKYHIVFRHFEAENKVVTPQISFRRLSPTTER